MPWDLPSPRPFHSPSFVSSVFFLFVSFLFHGSVNRFASVRQPRRNCCKLLIFSSSIFCVSRFHHFHNGYELTGCVFESGKRESFSIVFYFQSVSSSYFSCTNQLQNSLYNFYGDKYLFHWCDGERTTSSISLPL